MEDGSQVMWFSLVTKRNTDCHVVKMAPWFHPIILVEICRLLSMGGKPTLFRCLFIKVQCIDWGFFFSVYVCDVPLCLKVFFSPSIDNTCSWCITNYSTWEEKCSAWIPFGVSLVVWFLSHLKYLLVWLVTVVCALQKTKTKHDSVGLKFNIFIFVHNILFSLTHFFF